MTNNEYNPDEYLVLPLMLNKPFPVTQEIDKCIKDYYDEERKKKDREYYQANKERILKIKREYYRANKEHLLKKRAARLHIDYEKDPEKFRKAQLKFYYDNRERVLKERKEKRAQYEKITCECGSVIHPYFKTQHERTYKHCRYVEQQKK